MVDFLDVLCTTPLDWFVHWHSSSETLSKKTLPFGCCVDGLVLGHSEQNNRQCPGFLLVPHCLNLVRFACQRFCAESMLSIEYQNVKN